jgi:class 3 adenylate cyclase/tetratricopeptide (TPR) repeat protein
MSTDRAPTIVTFLFTDIVGSTSMHDALGDEGAQEVVRFHNSLVRAEVSRFGGSEVKTMGDGFMIAFGSVSAALNCAISIQRAIAQHNREGHSGEFMVRMGLNAGEAIQEEEDFFGAAVIVAARINALAEGGEILVSEAVKQLAQGMRGVEFKSKGEFSLKGLREQYRIYQATPTGQAEVLSLRRSRFVGRETELESLRRFLDETAGGLGRLVLLGGEAGVGKSRLSEEVAREARSRGFRVWRGHCSSTEGAPPYLPFVEVLRQYIAERPDDVLVDELGEEAPEIAKLVPELARRIAVRSDSVRLPPEQERYRLLESIRSLVESLAKRRPMLLLVEDVHWMDDASALLMRHLAQTLSGAPAMILATAREDEIGPAHVISESIAEFSRLQAYGHIQLTGLGSSEIEAMLSSLAAGPPPPELTQAIYRETEGNAFFVTELISHLHAERLLFDDAGNWRGDFATSQWNVPKSIRAVIQRRISSLDENVRKVLATAAVVGRQFSYEILDALAELDAEVLFEALDEGVRMGMVEQIERAATEFRFTHHLIQQTLYEDIPALRRQRSHLRVGEAMETASLGGPEELAYHFVQAGRMAQPQKTRGHLLAAGEKARTIAAWEEAADYFAQALALGDGFASDERAQLLWRLGEAQGGKGDWEGAVGNLRSAMDLFQELGDTENMAWIAYSLRRLYGARGQFEEAREIVERALASLGDQQSEVRSRLLAQAGFIRSAFGESGEAENLLKRSMEIAEVAGSAAAKGFSAFITGMHCLSYCRLQEATEWLTRGAEWSLEGNDLWSASQASSFRRHIAFSLGRLNESEGAMDEEERLARKAGNFLAVCETKWISSVIACLRGELAPALSLSNELVRLIEAAHADSGLPGALSNLAYIRYLQGDQDGFEEPLERALSVYQRMSAAPIDDPRPVLVLLRALSGRDETAREMISQLDRLFDLEAPWTASIAEARITLAAALAVLDDVENTRRLYGPLKEWTATAGYVLTGASTIPQLVHRVLGMAAATVGEKAEADVHFQRAIQQAADDDLSAELAECHYWYGRHLLARGEEQSGKGQLERAREIWLMAGMQTQSQRAKL